MNTNLTIEDLKNYKEQNPVKFEQKFLDLDLDNIPAGFNSMTYRKEVVKHTLSGKNEHKKYLKDLQPKVVEPEPEEVVNVDGGETLEDNKEE